MAGAKMNSSTSPRGEKRKFTFDTVFAANGDILRDGAFRSQFSREEAEQMRVQAFAEGKAAGEADVAGALAALAGSMNGLLGAYTAEARQLRVEAVELALAAARKVADVALEAHGEARVIEALTLALENLRAGPRLVVRIAPALMGALKSRLEEAAHAHGFDGALIVRADPTTETGDLALEWAEGAIVHDRAEAFALIEKAVQSALNNSDLELIDE
jgi:flagellar assembly protein FliH